MAPRPTRRGLLAALAGGLFAWLAPREGKAAAPAPAPPAPPGEAHAVGQARVNVLASGRLVYSTYPGGGAAPGPAPHAGPGATPG